MSEDFDAGENSEHQPQRRRKWSDNACDVTDCGPCCELGSLLDGGCWLPSLTLLGALGGLLAAVAGTGTLGHRLKHEPQAPPTPLAAALHRGVRYYQLRLSPRRPGHGTCRYTPTCSAYAAEALRRHGALKGARLAAARLRRCRPGTVGGRDLVP